MEIISTSWHLLSALVVFFIGVGFVKSAAKCLKVKFNRAILLYLWHTIFCMFALWHTLTYGGDAEVYYSIAKNNDIPLSFGTSAIYFITETFVASVDLSILGGFLVFNIFGSLGLIAFDASLQFTAKDKPIHIRRLATLIVFLPSISFWSTAIGKDALSFMASGFALWAALSLKNRFALMVLSIALMFIVRPHIAGIMTISFAISIFVDSGFTRNKKIIFGALIILIGAALVPYVLSFSGLVDISNISAANDFLEQRQGYNQAGGGSVDISSMSFPMQIFTYMFRPTLVEVRSVFELAASIDNLLLLYIAVAGFFAWYRSRRLLIKSDANRFFMWIYVLGTWVVLAMTTANLGISLRQKWMFAPFFICLCISYMGVHKHFHKRCSNEKPHRVESLS